MRIVWWSHVREFCDKVNELDPKTLENLRTLIPFDTSAQAQKWVAKGQAEEMSYGPEQVEINPGMRPGDRALALLK